MSFYQVAVNAPLSQTALTYSSNEQLVRGDIVEVPLGRRKVLGVVLEQTQSADTEFEIKDILDVKEDAFKINEQQLSLFSWMSKYYHYSLGQLVFDCLPKLMKRPREIEFTQGQNQSFEFSMNETQAEIVSSILSKEGFSQSLVHGVTGAGKTLVYLNLMKEVLEQRRKSVLFLLPEINLTPQFIQTFGKFLGCKILSYHSAITNSERYLIWKSLSEQTEPVLVMGVRSSVFLPIQNLGLVIVDEEHDQSFKQNDRCPYNGRDVATKKAQLANAPIVLGSATPTMESFHRLKSSGDYFAMKERAGGAHFPKIETIDIREKEEENLHWPLNEKSIEKMQNALDKGEQVLVFINKLGFANYLQCRACGHQFQNEDCGCGLNLRFFKTKNYLSCSHCEYKAPAPESCPSCGNLNLLQKGFGTERVQEVLQSCFKNKIVERFDRDEIKNFEQLNKKLDRFHSGEIDVLVGTQMLSKGHNFSKVNLVVILGVDSQLNFADFRAHEKVYQLITQVAGRSGRYTDYGEVVIQTMNPEHEVFEFLCSNDFDEFYNTELPMREVANCPPYSKVAMIYFSSKNRAKLIDSINKEAMNLNKAIKEKFQEVRLLGPIPSSIEKKANQFTWCMMLKSKNINQLHSVLSVFEHTKTKDYAISIKIDVDPQNAL